MSKVKENFYQGVNIKVETPFDFLEEGSFFGEISLFTRMNRTCSIKAMNNCTFAVLDRSVINEM
jgi:CRP-like cAMP-binding protein